jgi:RNA polymerase sigma-70 factor (ECF subfamily)
MMHTTPLSLLQRLQESPTADDWARFVRLCTPLLYGWARRTGLQEADAADLVQDVFTLLLVKLPTFRHQGPGSFRGWLRTVTLNKYRERGRRATLPLAGHVPLEDLAAPDSLAESWDAEYRQHLVGQALRLMRAEFQSATWQACWEHVVGGKSAAQVGSQLGLTPGAVRAAKFRVLNRLRQELRDLLD